MHTSQLHKHDSSDTLGINNYAPHKNTKNWSQLQYMRTNGVANGVCTNILFVSSWLYSYLSECCLLHLLPGLHFAPKAVVVALTHPTLLQPKEHSAKLCLVNKDQLHTHIESQLNPYCPKRYTHSFHCSARNPPLDVKMAFACLQSRCSSPQPLHAS